MAGILTTQNPFLIFFFRLCPHFSEVEILIYLWRLTHSVLFLYWKVNLFTSTQFKTGVNIYVFSILLLKEEGPFSFISQIQKCLVFYVNRTTLPYHEDCQWCIKRRIRARNDYPNGALKSEEYTERVPKWHNWLSACTANISVVSITIFYSVSFIIVIL